MSVNIGGRARSLNISVAYPGRLGQNLPTPPPGFLPEGTGFSAISRDGVFLNWIEPNWVYPDGTVYGG